MKQGAVKRPFQTNSLNKAIEPLDYVVARMLLVDHHCRPDGRAVNAPQLVVGKLEYQDGEIAGYATIPTSKTFAKTRPGFLTIAPQDCKNGMSYPHLLETGNLRFVAIDDIDTRKGAIASLNKSLWPDIIAARATALWSETVNKEPCWDFDNATEELFYNGFCFDTVGLEHIADFEKQPDIDPKRSLFRNKSDAIIKSSDINTIKNHTIKLLEIARDNPHMPMHSKPENGTWPLWADIPPTIQDPAIKCCSIETGGNREKAQRQLRQANLP